MAGAPSQKLSSIEALRGLAATAVVLTHSARHVDKAYGDPALLAAFQAGHAGVDLFFAISGFIILFVHHADIGQPGRLPTYARRRFTRVVPLYWVALGLTVAMAVAGSGNLPPLPFLLWSASLLPTAQEPFLGVAWTLQHEAVFYVVFAAVIAWRGAGLAILAAWLAAICTGILGFSTSFLPGGLSGAYGIEFFFGMGAALLVRRRLLRAPTATAWAGAALFGTALVCESAGVLDGYGAAARFAYGLPAAFLIAGLATREQSDRLAIPASLRMLGGASYSIYLFQFVAIGVIWQAWLRAGLGERLPHVVLFAVLAIGAMTVGVVANRTIEQPLLRLFRGRSTPSRAAIRPA